jgi:hypothetical protein
MEQKSLGVCPNCKNDIPGAHRITGKGIPNENDIAFCKDCQRFLVFQNNGQWKLFPEEELKQMAHYGSSITLEHMNRKKEIILAS